MSQSMNIGEGDKKWSTNNSEQSSASKPSPQDPLQALLLLFQESSTSSSFQNRFYVLIIDPSTYQVEKRSILDLNLRTLDHYVIIDQVTDCCYCSQNSDAGTLRAISTYAPGTEVTPLPETSWEQAEDSFVQHAQTAQSANQDRSLTAFYEELAEERAREIQDQEKKAALQKQHRDDISMQKLAGLLAHAMGSSRLARLREVQAEHNTASERAEHAKLDAQQLKEYNDMKALLKEEIAKEEIKRDNKKELDREPPIEL